MRLHLTGGRPARLFLIGLAAAAAVAVAAAVVWRFALRDTTKAVSIDEALTRFREHAADNSGRIPPGVYVYATKGYEFVSALGGHRHRYPARSTITITKSRCGVNLRWDPLTTRSNTMAVCSAGRALGLTGWSERHEFFGQRDQTDWRCDGTAWLPSKPSSGAVSRWRCRSADSKQVGRLSVVGTDTLRVGPSRLPAVHLRAEARETGGARGPLVEERWLEPETGLPLRIVYRVRTQNPSPVGDVTFEERYDLRLLSLVPRR